jgi:hypothetical protein
VLGDLDAHFGANFLNEEAIGKRTRDNGLSTAIIGKVGPTLLFDHTERGRRRVVVDHTTGSAQGIPIFAEPRQALARGWPSRPPTPGRAVKGAPGNATTPGAKVANVAQQDYFVAVAAAQLRLFAARDKPFLLVFWSCDPDRNQHNEATASRR